MHPVLRIVWFVTVGWWLGVIWVLLAALAAVTAIWFNVGVMIIVNTWRVITLEDPPREIIEDIRRIR